MELVQIRFYQIKKNIESGILFPTGHYIDRKFLQYQPNEMLLNIAAMQAQI